MAFKTYHRSLIDKFLKKQHLEGAILDVGAKQRRYDALFKENKITACDLKPQKGIEFCDVCSLPYKDNSFENILCIEVLQYLTLEKVPLALKEMKRVLKPGGLALITVPFFYKDHKDNLRFTADYFSFILKESGFGDFEIIRMGNKFTAYYDIMRNSYFKARFSKPFYFLEAALAALAIKTFRLEKIKDDFYTGLFIKARTACKAY